DLESPSRTIEELTRAQVLLLEMILLLTERFEFPLGRLRSSVRADSLESGGCARSEPSLELLPDRVEEYRAHRPQLTLHNLNFAHERLEHPVFRTLSVDEVVTADLGRRLQDTVDPAISLFETRRVPGHVHVEQAGAIPLEVHAFPRRVRRGEDAHREDVWVGSACPL